jgi:hypothetical protein
VRFIQAPRRQPGHESVVDFFLSYKPGKKEVIYILQALDNNTGIAQQV